MRVVALDVGTTNSGDHLSLLCFLITSIGFGKNPPNSCWAKYADPYGFSTLREAGGATIFIAWQVCGACGSVQRNGRAALGRCDYGEPWFSAREFRAMEQRGLPTVRFGLHPLEANMPAEEFVARGCAIFLHKMLK